MAKVEPLLTTSNDKGEVEGVKFGQINVVLINAIQEQQKQIDERNETIKKQQADIETLKLIVCSQATAVAACRRDK